MGKGRLPAGSDPFVDSSVCPAPRISSPPAPFPMEPAVSLPHSIRCRLVTPTASLLDEQVTYASIPAWDGLFGVQGGHAPLLSRLGTGELRLDFADTSKGKGGRRSYALDGGFVRIVDNQLTILAERAIAAEHVVVADVEKSVTQLESSPASERRARDLSYAQTQLNLAKGSRGI